MSFRDTGICRLTREDGSITIEASHLENPKCNGSGFLALKECSRNMRDNTITPLKAIVNSGWDMVIIEMPCFTQSSLSALLIGMCWGAIMEVDPILIEPSAIKRWSGSKKGDKKTKVKEKVLQRVALSQKEASNDNIVDAVGIAFFVSDLISTIHHEHHTHQ